MSVGLYRLSVRVVSTTSHRDPQSNPPPGRCADQADPLDEATHPLVAIMSESLNLDARGFVGHPQGMSCRGHMVAPGVRLDERAHLWVGCPLALPHVRLVVSVEPSGLANSLARSMSSR